MGRNVRSLSWGECNSINQFYGCLPKQCPCATEVKKTTPSTRLDHNPIMKGKCFCVKFLVFLMRSLLLFTQNSYDASYAFGVLWIRIFSCEIRFVAFSHPLSSVSRLESSHFHVSPYQISLTSFNGYESPGKTCHGLKVL